MLTTFTAMEALKLVPCTRTRSPPIPEDGEKEIILGAMVKTSSTFLIPFTSTVNGPVVAPSGIITLNSSVEAFNYHALQDH